MQEYHKDQSYRTTIVYYKLIIQNDLGIISEWVSSRHLTIKYI